MCLGQALRHRGEEGRVLHALAGSLVYLSLSLRGDAVLVECSVWKSARVLLGRRQAGEGRPVECKDARLFFFLWGTLWLLVRVVSVSVFNL